MKPDLINAAILRLQGSVVETYEAIKDTYIQPSDEGTVDRIATLAARLANLEGGLITLQQYAQKIVSDAKQEELEIAVIAARQVQKEIEEGKKQVDKNLVVTEEMSPTLRRSQAGRKKKATSKKKPKAKKNES